LYTPPPEEHDASEDLDYDLLDETKDGKGSQFCLFIFYCFITEKDTKRRTKTGKKTTLDSSSVVSVPITPKKRDFSSMWMENNASRLIFERECHNADLQARREENESKKKIEEQTYSLRHEELETKKKSDQEMLNLKREEFQHSVKMQSEEFSLKYKMMRQEMVVKLMEKGKTPEEIKTYLSLLD
jgi:hypothetical protein